LLPYSEELTKGRFLLNGFISLHNSKANGKKLSNFNWLHIVKIKPIFEIIELQVWTLEQVKGNIQHYSNFEFVDSYR
jgi:hypothetical protein